MPVPATPCVLVLASGQGRRFVASGGQGNKLEALLDGVTLIDHVLQAVRTSGLPWHVERRTHAGMGDCIAAAVAATASADGWLVLPADLPRINPATLRRVADMLWGGAAVVVPCWQGRRGHPVGFSTICRDRLLALEGAAGATAVVAEFANREQVVWLDQPDAGCVQDVDTLQQLQAMQAI